MSLPILPNPTNLVGVALVINRTRDGANLVFHYPPEISLSPATPLDTSLDTSIDAESAQDDIILECLCQPDRALDSQGHHQNRGRDDSTRAAAPWELVTGFPTGDLASLLSPARPYHKRLFQVSLDSLYYVSCPVHVPENGIWRKKKKQKSKPQKKADSSSNLADSVSTLKDGSDQPVGPPCESEEPTINIERWPDARQPPAGTEEGAEEEKKVSSMTMFNVVFILNPKKHEVRELVNTLYSNIIKKVNKAYKYCQQHSDFVWKESKQIIRLKEKAREEKTPMHVLWKEILKVSSLASSVQEIYQSLSLNRIISLQLDTANGPLSLSMQIPVPFYIPDLGPENETAQHGLWLTSANTFVPEEAFEEPEFLEKNFGLLLMDNEKKIISQLPADLDPSTIAMVEFVRMCKPTMSLYQIGQGNILSHSQVRKYAHHFISWRRAIAIPPLHARDMYIMSPNSDLARLPRASQEWARSFPLAPPLTSFLAELSYAPRPYKHFCPSKAHRPNYLAMLAWLMRGGWVTQLCTFAYVVVWPEIIYEVEHQLEAEALRADKAPVEGSPPSGPGSGPESVGSQSSDSSTTSPPPPTLSPSQGDPAAIDPLMTNPSPSPSSSSTPPSDQQPTTAAQKIAEKARLDRITTKAHREAAEKATAHTRKPLPAPTLHPSTNSAPHLTHLDPYIIPDAGRATGKDSLYLDAIGRRLRLAHQQRRQQQEGQGGKPSQGDEAGEKLGAAWQRFWKYFDGKCALERIALQEDMKRKEAWNMLTAMSEYLLCVRHW